VRLGRVESIDMNYQIDETEYNHLESVRDQLAFVMGLLTIADVELGSITSTSLYAFLDGRSQELDRVLKAASDRHAQQRALEKEQGTMQCWDWMHALRIANGDFIHTPNGSEQRITETLSKAAQIDADMRHVLDTWMAVLGRTGQQLASVPATPTRAVKPRKHKRPAIGDRRH